MVLVKEATLILLQHLKKSLGEQVTQASRGNVLLAAFAEWLRLGVEETGSVDAAASKAAIAKPAERSSRVLAVLGFRCRSRSVDRAGGETFRKYLEWVIGKPNFDATGEPCGALVDPIILLGTSVGAETQASGDLREAFVRWTVRLEEDLGKVTGSWPWHAELVRLVLAKVSGTLGSVDIPSLLWLSAGLSLGEFCEIRDEQAADVLKDSLERADEPMDDFEAALRLAALNWAKNRALDYDFNTLSVSDVARILKNVPEVFLRWTWENKPRTKRSSEARKWHIDNEYHVQNLLFTILKPIFLELDQERYLTSTGRYQPRADLCLPSLQLVIEVKFWYQNSSLREITEEIASDHSLYLRPDSPYRRMIAMIWDEGVRTEEHREFERGLSGLSGMDDVIVISRPSTMAKGKVP